MSSIQKHKLKNKMAMQALLGGEEDVFFGGASAEDAATYANLIAELAKAGGGVAAAELKKKEDAEKAAKEAAKNKDANDARAAAAAARKKAAIAAAEALAEKDPNGPLHKAAERAETEARVAEAKAAVYSGGTLPSGNTATMALPPAKAGIPWWGWLLGAGLVTVGGAFAYKLVRK
jgi:colicin import membrane protein